MNERYILGSKVNDVDLVQAVKMARTFLVGTKTSIVVTPNPEICLRGYRDTMLREITKKADLAIADGNGLKLGARILGQRIENVVTGVDFSQELLSLAEQYSYSVLLLGGKGKTGTKAVENIKANHPSLKVDYLNGGIFSEKGVPEDPDLISTINSKNSDLILINLGAPKQEYFMWKYKGRLNAKLLIGVGGTIDFLSGQTKRAPRLLRKLWIEWLYRLIKQPWRWKRIFNAVIVFPITCIWWRIRTALIFRRGVVGFTINNDKEILIAKRKNRPGDKAFGDHWQLPQGAIDYGETLKKAIKREMAEEVGLHDLEVLGEEKDCYRYTWPRHAKLYQPYKGQKQSLLLLLHKGPKDAVKVDEEEFTDYKWVSKHHILESVHPYRRAIIKIGLSKFKDYL